MIGTDHFPLDQAYLCVDCKQVGNNSRVCPACASESLMGLAAVLDHEERRQAPARISFISLAPMVQ